jgi:hypothetical protein
MRAPVHIGEVAAVQPDRRAAWLLSFRAAVRDASYVLIALAAALWFLIWVRSAVHDGSVGFDFEGTLWNPATAIREGHSPYPSPTVAEVDVGNPSLYPPLLPVLLAPLTVLPWTVAVSFWVALLIASIAGTLYLLGVRDVRCYALAFVSAPVLNGIIWSNVTLLLVPAVALAWRWRERWARAGVIVGLAIAAKLILWPLLFWLLGTRRYKAFGIAVATSTAAIFLPWAVIGFDGLTGYPDLLHVAEQVFGPHSYSVATMLSAEGVDGDLALRAAPMVGLLIALVAGVAGWRGRDAASISLAVLATILGSTIVWEYYYALLLVPLAIARPRFSGLWMVMPLFYFSHRLPRPQLTWDDIQPGGSACCQPPGVPLPSWVFNHAPPGLWPALGHAALATAAVLVVVALSRPRSDDKAAEQRSTT